jgi:transposase InsO family protein
MAGLICGVVRKSTREILDPVVAACCAILEAAQAAITFNSALFRTCYGPEFIAQKVRDWKTAVAAKTAHFEPGSPWGNGYCESFNARFRDELMNVEIFYSLREAQILIEQLCFHYNTVRPHSSLGYRPPAPESIVLMDQRPTMH